MGKVRRQRQKLHLSAKRTQSSDVKAPTDALPLPDKVIFPTADGLFSKKDLDGVDLLSQQLPIQRKHDDDQMTYISKKSINDEGRMKKKEKMKVRHERWLQKIDTIKEAKKSKKAAQHRSQVPIVGDLHPLSLALPELTEILRLDKTRKAKQPQQARNSRKKDSHQSTMKTKERKNMLLEEQARFQQVLSHSAFKSNPLSTINEHLRNKIQKEQEQQSMEPGH